MSCMYCERGDDNIRLIHDYDNWVYVKYRGECNSWPVLTMVRTTRKGRQEAFTEIGFCPMCGRDLKGEGE